MSQGVEQLLFFSVMASSFRTAVRMNSHSEDWTLVDIQGSLRPEATERQDAGDECVQWDALDGISVGDLLLDPDSDSAVLLIQNHRLDGKVVKLAHPLHVLEKRSNDKQHGSGSGPTSWVVVGIASRSITFNERPKPLIRKSGIKATKSESKPFFGGN